MMILVAHLDVLAALNLQTGTSSKTNGTGPVPGLLKAIVKARESVGAYAVAKPHCPHPWLPMKRKSDDAGRQFLRRAEIGIHHHIAGRHLHAYAAEMAWREDASRVGNGTQYTMAVAAVAVAPKSADWCGYWQRASAEA